MLGSVVTDPEIFATQQTASENPPRRSAFLGLHGRLSSLYNVLQGSDGIPTTQAVSAVREALAELEGMLGG